MILPTENQVTVNLDLVKRFNPTVALIAGIIAKDNEWATLEKLTNLTGLSKQALAREINTYLYDKNESYIFTKRKWFLEKEGKIIVIYGLTTNAFNSLIGE